jgi:DNA modification methylase
VPVLDCTGWTESQRRAYIIADNALALQAGWDEALLKGELGDLRDAGFDIAMTGFSDVDLDIMLRPARPGADPDEAPDVPQHPTSKLGDVWLCGGHRVVCGSSTDSAAWDALMAGEEAQAGWTDPPYNVDYQGRAGSLENDSLPDAEFRRFLRASFGLLFAHLSKGSPVYVAHADGKPGESFRSAFREAGFELSGCLIWQKDHFTLSRSDYQWQHEAILYGWKPGVRHRWYGGRKLSTSVDLPGWDIAVQDDGRLAIRVGDTVLVLPPGSEIEELPGSIARIERPRRSEQHPTMKPVALVERMLSASAKSGELVADGFGGSGTTMIAADRLGMRARLLELDPRYVDVIVQRWQDYSGGKAKRA